MKTLAEIEKIKEELAVTKLLEADQHAFGYATAGKEINAIIGTYRDAFDIGFDACLALMLEREKVAKDFIGQLSFGLLPNGDHVEGATMEYAEKILEKLK